MRSIAHAPDAIAVPSGRSVRLEYADDGIVSASVKLQELFGLADTPRVGRASEPVRFALLAPNGRPVQVTRDLRSFWDRTYPEVQEGASRPLSEAPLARRSLESDADRSNQEPSLAQRKA